MSAGPRSGRVRLTGAGVGAGAAPTGSAGGSLTGTYPNPTIASIPSGATATTQTAGDNSTKVATTAFVAALSGNALSGVSKIVRRTADSSSVTASTTLANDDTLLWAIGASDVWLFECILQVSAANATMDIKFGWTVPASATMTWAGDGGGATGTAWGNLGTAGASLVLLSESQTASFGTAIGTTGHKITGIVVGGGSAGNVNLKWAQSTSDAGALVMKANSLIRATRLA